MIGIRAFGVAVLLLATGTVLRGQEPAAPDTTMLSLDAARTLALAQVPDNEGLQSGRLDTKGGRPVYTFEIATRAPGHQEVRVDARTGAIVSSRHADDVVGEAEARVSRAARSTGEATKHVGATVAGDARHAGRTVAHGATVAGRSVAGVARGAAAKVHHVLQGEDLKKANPTISEERARAIAQAAVADAPVTAAALARDDGVLVWKIDLNTPGKGYDEVTVDATTGQVIGQDHRK